MILNTSFLSLHRNRQGLVPARSSAIITYLFPYEISWSKNVVGHWPPRAQGALTMHLCSLPASDFSALMQHQENRSGVRSLGRALVQMKEFRASWAPFVPLPWDCLEHRGTLRDLQSQLCPCSYKRACAHPSPTYPVNSHLPETLAL